MPVLLWPTSRVDPRDVLVRLQWQPLREDGHTTAPFGKRCRVSVNFSCGHDRHRCGRSIVRRSAAGYSRRLQPCAEHQIRDHGAKLASRHRPRAQQPDGLAFHAHDRGLESDLTFAAVEDHFHGIAQLIAYMLGAGGRKSAVPVGRRRRDSAAECSEELLRHRMRGDADGHGILATGDDIVHVQGTRQHHRQGARPEALRELVGRIGHFADPPMQITRAVQMNDDGMTGGPALGFEDLADRGGVLCIRTQAVNGLGGKRHELTVAQGLHGRVDLDLGCSDNSNHDRRILPAARARARIAPGPGSHSSVLRAQPSAECDSS